MNKMTFKLGLMLFALPFVFACGSLTTAQSSSTTVTVKATDGSSSVPPSLSKASQVANSTYVRTYSFCLSSSTCSSSLTDSDFTCVFDKVSDGTVSNATTDCESVTTSNAASSDAAVNIAGNIASIASDVSFSAGDYKCARIKMCDQLAIQADDLSTCANTTDGTFTLMDVSGSNETNTAEVASYYWGVGGSSTEEDGEGDTSGTADTPFELTSAVVITEGSSNTVTITLNNRENQTGANADGMWVSDVDTDGDGTACDLPQPNMTIAVE